MRRFKVIKIDGARDKQLIFRAHTWTEQGTTFKFWDEQNSYVEEFEKNEIRFISDFETDEQIYPHVRKN